MPMSNQSTTSNTRRHIRQRQCTTQRMHWVTFKILNSMHNSATDRRWGRLHSKTTPARKPAHLITLSSSLRYESAAEHHTAEQYSKTGRTSSKCEILVISGLRLVYGLRKYFFIFYAKTFFFSVFFFCTIAVLLYRVELQDLFVLLLSD